MIFPFEENQNLFEEYFSNNESLFNKGSRKQSKSFWMPAADVYEDVNYFKFKIDLPGVKKDGISIKIKNGKLIVSGQRKLQFENPIFKYHKIERSFGNFYREFSLPENISESEIQAELKDGELIVSLPKIEANVQNIKNIEIK